MAAVETTRIKALWRSRSRAVLAGMLFLPQVFWDLLSEWPGLPALTVVDIVLLACGAAAAMVPRPWGVQSAGLGLLLLNPTTFTAMTVAFGSANAYGRTGIELFGVIGFSWGVAFVGGYWLNRWQQSVESGRPAGSLSTGALFTAVAVLCTPSIIGWFGLLLLKASYPDGLIPESTIWGKSMIFLMLVSAPSALLGLGLLVLATPMAIHLIRTRGWRSGVGRATVCVGLLALLSAAMCLN